MKKTISHLCITACFSLLTLTLRAQSPQDIKAQMVKDWERARDYTREYLNTMHADKYSFKATDSVRSFAQQMLHLAGANVFITSQVSQDNPPAGFGFDMEQRASAQNKDSVMYYVMTSYDYAINSVKNTDVSKWGDEITVFNRFKATKFAMLNKAFEHQTHHRGQTTIYIRLVGIKPPQEKLF